MPTALSKCARRWQVYLAEGDVQYTRYYVGCVEVFDDESVDEAVERRRLAHQGGREAGGAVWLSLCRGTIRIRKLGPALSTASSAWVRELLYFLQLFAEKGWRIKP